MLKDNHSDIIIPTTIVTSADSSKDSKYSIYDILFNTIFKGYSFLL